MRGAGVDHVRRRYVSRTASVIHAAAARMIVKDLPGRNQGVVATRSRSLAMRLSNASLGVR